MLPLIILLASVPCEPFATSLVVSPAEGLSRLPIVGWAGSQLIAIDAEDRFFEVDVFSHEVKWIGDPTGLQRRPRKGGGSGLSGPRGLIVFNGVLLDSGDQPARWVDAELQSAVEHWPRRLPVGYRPSRVLRDDAGGWVLVAHPVHRSVDDIRVFSGSGGRFEEAPLLGFSLSLAAEFAVTVKLGARLLKFKFFSGPSGSLPVEVTSGGRPILGHREVAVTELPKHARFTCLQPLPMQRWW